MTDGAYSNDGVPGSPWYVYDDSGFNNIPLKDNMDLIEITSEMRGIATENVPVLKFEVSDD